MADITQIIVLDWPDIGYDEKDDRISKFYSQQTDVGVTSNKHSIFYKKKAIDVFIAAMALGKKAGHKKDFSDGKKASNIPKEVMGRNSTYVWMMIAVALEETGGDHTIFEQGHKIVEICEQYANYGIRELMEIDSQASADDPLRGFETEFQELLDEIADDGEKSTDAK